MGDARAHSRFGGSIAARYINCAGSVALNATIPQKRASASAAEGTVAHHVAAQCLAERLHPTHFLGEVIEADGYQIPVTQEMCDAVVVYLNAVEIELARTRTAQYFVEQSFDLNLASAENGEVHGANDCCVYHPETGRLRVFDYKHGVGVSVDAEDNAQLKFYALGALYANPGWKISEIILTIVQPRARDAEDVGAVKDWPFDLVEVLEFASELDTAVARAKTVENHFGAHGELDLPYTEGPALVVGPWCDKTWCPAKAAGKCPAANAAALAAAGLDFAGVKPITLDQLKPDLLPDPAHLDGETLARVVAGLDYLVTFANRCQEYLEAMVLSGHQVPGWKAVEKIGRAKWIDDPNQIVAYATMVHGLDAGQLTPPKLVTITEAEKLLKAAGAPKDAIDDFKLKFTIKESSGLTIAPASDRRPAVNAVAADMGSVNLAAIAAE